MDTKILEDIGLTPGETKVYLALLRLGLTTTGPLAEKAQVSSSKVYKILSRLKHKGLAGQVIRGKTAYFSAVDPKRILDYLEEKEAQLQKNKEAVQQLIPQLELEQQLAKQKTEVILLTGFKAIMNLYRGVLAELKRGDEYYVINAGYGDDIPGVRAFFQNYHTQRINKGIKVIMLANHDTRGNLVPATKRNSEVRYLPPYVKENMMVLFYRNKAFLFFLIKEPKGFLIENKEVVDGFTTYFNELWKIAKP